jgi:hypothetical protein
VSKGPTAGRVTPWNSRKWGSQWTSQMAGEPFLGTSDQSQAWVCPFTCALVGVQHLGMLTVQLGGVCVCLSLLLIDHPWTHSSLFSPSALRPWAISSPLDTYQSRYTRPQQRFQWKGSSRGQDYIRRRERKFCSWHYELWFQIHMIQGKIHVWFTTWPGVWSIGIVWTLAQVLET